MAALSRFSDRDLPFSKRAILAAIVTMIGVLAAAILTSYTNSIAETRARMRFAHVTYFAEEERKGFALDMDNTSFWHDPVLMLAFYGATIAGFVLTFDVQVPELNVI